MDHNADQPVKEAVPAPAALPAATPDVAAPGLSGFAAAMGNQAFNAYIARAPRLVPTGQVIARDPPQKPNPEEVTADDRQSGMIQSLITLPLATAEGNLASNPNKTMLKSIRRRVAAARGAFGAFKFPRESKPGQRMLSSQARVDVALALLDGMLSDRPDRLLRAHWGKTLSLCKSLSRSLPKPTEAEPEDKRALMRDSVCPAVAAAIADIPAIVAADSEDMLHLVGNHDTVPEAIFTAAGDKGIAAAVEFKKGIELVKLMARPQEERAAFIAAHLNRASTDLLRLNQDMSEDADLVEPGEEPPPDDPSLNPAPTPDPNAPPDPAPSPNPLPPPPPPPLPDPGAPSDAGVAPPAAGVP